MLSFLTVTGCVLTPTKAHAVDHLSAPVIFDNLGGTQYVSGQTFVAETTVVTGIQIYIGDPTRIGEPSVNELIGPATLELYDSNHALISKSQVVESGASVSGLVTLRFTRPILTEIGAGYFIGIRAADLFGVGLRSAATSTYAFGAESWHDFTSGFFFSHPSGRDVSFKILADGSAPRGAKLFALCIGQNDGVDARGDIAAQAVFEKLKSKASWAGTELGNGNFPVTFSSNFNDNLGSIVSLRLDAMQVRDGDTLVFFYNGHAGPKPGYGDGGETPVNLGLFGSNQSTDDEILASDLTDDDLYRLFNTEKWRNVRKIFLIDSCHSGGMVGSSTTDGGDLERLPNMALFASSLEDGNAQGDPFDGQGIWSKYLLLPALDDADLTTAQLQISINSRLGSIVDAFSGQTLPLFDLNSPGATSVFSLNPYFVASSDFDASQTIGSMTEPGLSFINQGDASGIIWLSESGHSYQLEESSDLIAWHSFGAPVVGTGNYARVDLPKGEVRGFYRLRY